MWAVTVRVELGPLDGLALESVENSRSCEAGRRYSLSSKSSANRFLVIFHTMNAMMPSTATPPATDNPMIVDFPTDLGASSVFPWLSSEVALADVDDDVPEGVCVMTTVTTSPSSFVDAELERIIEGVGVWVGGGVVFAPAVLLGGADVVLGG